MTKNVLVLFTLCLLVNLSCSKNNSSSPPKSDVNLKSGLLVYLDFNGVVADSSGNNNPAAIAGNGSLSYDEHGNANSAFNGNGDGGRVLVTNNGSIKFDTAFSVSCDVMVKSLGICTYVSMVNDASGYGASFAFGTDLLQNQNLAFGVVDTTANCNGNNTVQNTPLLNPSFLLEPYSWYNAIAIFHKGVMEIYINGKLVGSMISGPAKVNLCSNAQFTIGDFGGGEAGQPGFIQNGINGKLDEVRLYNRVLNADEIAELSKNFQ